MRLNAPLCTATAVQYAGVVAVSLRGIHNAMVKCLFNVNRSCIHKGFQVSPHVKIQRIKL
jgi:hypothetical protein